MIPELLLFTMLERVLCVSQTVAESVQVTLFAYIMKLSFLLLIFNLVWPNGYHAMPLGDVIACHAPTHLNRRTNKGRKLGNRKTYLTIIRQLCTHSKGNMKKTSTY